MRFLKPVSGGVELPALNNPASGSEILAGYQGINGAGGLVEGTHVCAGLDETTADATAGAGDILAGKTAYAKGQKITGSHVCPTVADLTADADATAGDIASGKTAWVKGEKVVGTGRIGFYENKTVNVPYNFSSTPSVEILTLEEGRVYFVRAEVSYGGTTYTQAGIIENDVWNSVASNGKLLIGISNGVLKIGQKIQQNANNISVIILGV